jgi:phenylpropionate dioxygenase-like ring-hydroxylating dioxygenase large terminal subunit
VGDNIQCPYHGWEFDTEGACAKIPALDTPMTNKASRVPSYPVCEREGYVWVFTDCTQAPNHTPYSLPFIDDSRYLTIRYEAEFEATLHATAENVLDVPHTAFLHAGLFRGGGGEPNPIDTEVRRYFDRSECHYIGEPRPSGVMGKLMAPGGGEVTHVDRFILPSVAQVEYQLGDGIHLISTSCLSPISAFRTRMNAVVTVRVGKWATMLRPIVTPFALKVVKQDIEILSAQTQTIKAFGGESYAHSQADLLGPSIVKLLKKAVSSQVPIAQEPPTGEPEATSTGKLTV